MRLAFAIAIMACITISFIWAAYWLASQVSRIIDLDIEE